jgi:predicted nucleic acid-binding protein
MTCPRAGVTTPGTTGPWTAWTACAYSMPLLTRNPDDFTDLRRLLDVVAV